MGSRQPAVAHQFYPGDPATLQRTLEQLVPTADQAEPALAVVLPHAGYVYSGAVAGATVARARVPNEVVVLGPNHHGLGAAAAVMERGSWRMPWGEVAINTPLASSILNHCPDLEADELAHLREHSLEVLIPFLHHRQPALEIVPICLARNDYDFCRRTGQGLATALKTRSSPVMLAASTDMTHYESRHQAGAKDRLAIEQILALDPEGLYHTVGSQRISMCGVIPTVITLIAALELGATQARLVRYSDSGEVSGDTEQVVGYAGFVIN